MKDTNRLPCIISVALIVFLGISGCIGTDFIEDTIEERITIISDISELQVGESYQLMATFWDNTGQQLEVSFSWDSSDPAIISVDSDGVITANSMGMATITVSANGIVEDLTLAAGNMTVETPSDQRTGSLVTTSSYPLSGDVTLIDLGNGDLRLEIASNFETTSALPGLYVYLANNPNTINNAYEIGAVTRFSGAQEYTITGVGLNDFNYVLFYCKPFVVDVGNAELD